MFDLIDKKQKGTFNPVNAFRFKTYHRMQDMDSQKVRYKKEEDYILPLNVPLNMDIEEVFRLRELKNF